MDPEKQAAIRRQIDATVIALNILAFARYGALLKLCGVKQVQVKNIFMLP